MDMVCSPIPAGSQQAKNSDSDPTWNGWVAGMQCSHECMPIRDSYPEPERVS